MARSYGQLFAGIWRDDDFRKLPTDAQWAYIMLISQADISSCGLLSMTLGRWAQYADDMTRDELAEALSDLASARFIVVDFDTEEVLVRTFAKWDGGYTNPNRRKAIVASVGAVVSPRLKATAIAELDRLGITHGLSASPFEDPSEGPLDALAKPTSTPKVLVTLGDHIPEPETGTHNPEPGNLKPEAGSLAQIAPRAELALVGDGTTAQIIVGEWIDHCARRPPGNVVGPVAKSVAVMLGEGIDPDDIRRGLSSWMTKGLHPSTLPSVVNEVMNAQPSRPRHQDETDAMFERAAKRLGVNR